MKSCRPDCVAVAVLLLAVLLLAALLRGQDQQFWSGHRSQFPTGYEADRETAIACCDVDGDGDDDAIVANNHGSATGPQRLYLNDGSGRFEAAPVDWLPNSTPGSSVSSITPCDIDADGDPDLVLIGSHIRLFGNDGTGRFTDVSGALVYATPAWSFGPSVILDVDRDGDQDLVVGDRSSMPLRLYRNDGSGRFTWVAWRLPPSGGGWVNALACADVEGDGDLDLVLGDNQDVFLWLNDGTGAFLDATSGRIPVEVAWTDALITLDADGDGDIDLIPNRGQSPRLYLNDGTGTFADATTARLPASGAGDRVFANVDVDGDADFDLLVAKVSGPVVWLNDGTGHFHEPSAPHLPASATLGTAPGWFAISDVDRDHDPDIVSIRGHRPEAVLLNDGSGRFSSTSIERMPLVVDVGRLAFCDVDGDDDPDLLLGTTHRAPWLRLYVNDRGWLTDASANLPAAAWSLQAIVSADVDRDGDFDIVVGRPNRPTQLLTNDGSGRFVDDTLQRMPPRADPTVAVVASDVDGDGDPDLVLGNPSAQDRLYLNDGSGRFQDATSTHLPLRLDDTTAIVAIDVDLDGDPDLVSASGSRHYFHGGGSSVFVPIPRQNRLYVNDGTGVFHEATAARLPRIEDATFAVVACDANRDGAPDLVFGNLGQTRLCLNDGTGVFVEATARLPTRSEYTWDVAVCDYDGDGADDLVLANGTYPPPGGQNLVYRNDGTGRFTDVTAACLPFDDDPTHAVACADIDRDGDPDLLFGNASMPVRTHVNRLRQLHAPQVARLGHRYRLDVHAVGGAPSALDVALIALSHGTASIAVPPFGVFGLDPASLVQLTPQVVPRPAGVASVSFVVPNLASLAGAQVYSQALLVRYLVEERLTGVVAETVFR